MADPSGPSAWRPSQNPLRQPAAARDGFRERRHDPTLNYNPTNLHVHGMLVEPRVPTPQRKSYGDTIYVLAFPSANVASNQGQYFQPPTNPLPPAPDNIKVPFAPSVGPHQYVDILPDVIDYEFNVPGNHPSGTFISTHILTGRRRTKCKPGFPRSSKWAAPRPDVRRLAMQQAAATDRPRPPYGAGRYANWPQRRTLDGNQSVVLQPERRQPNKQQHE